MKKLFVNILSILTLILYGFVLSGLKQLFNLPLIAIAAMCVLFVPVFYGYRWVLIKIFIK